MLRALVTLCIIAVSCLPHIVQAGGFAIPPQGARATAFGLAYGPIAEDLTAAYHNPAGLAEQRGTRVYLGAHTGKARIDLTMPGEDKVGLEKDILYYPFIGVSTDFNSQRFTTAFSVYAPFGAMVTYPDDGPQKNIAQKIQLVTYNFTGSLACKVTDKLSLGAGLSYVYASAMLRVVYNIEFLPGILLHLPIEMNASDSAALGFNAGALYHLTDKLHLSCTYTSRVTGDLTGDVDIVEPIPGIPIEKFDIDSLEVSTPDVYRVGACYEFSDRFRMSAEVYYWDWSILDAFVVKVSGIPDEFAQLGFETIVFPKDFSDSYSYGLGSQYRFTRRSSVTLGAFYDTTPIPDHTNDLVIPDSDKLGVVLGYLYDSDSINASIVLANGFYDDRNITNSIMTSAPTNGLYEYGIFLIMGDITYTF
ncbi:outer membrane protein transport protein [bacterium]|nr:outer membrane protein transport protein [candidate division CSSED10-310 bacterium]